MTDEQHPAQFDWATLLSVRGELASREAEIALLKKALMDAEAPQPTPTAQAAESVLKDHQIAALVNELRDIAVQYHGTQQLRERIAQVVVPALRAADSVLEDAARLDWLESQSQVNIERVRYLGADTSIHEVTPFNGTDFDGETLRKAIDAARKQGANHD